jgi:KDO2-lipid IV(A) lauroyltransferase
MPAGAADSSLTPPPIPWREVLKPRYWPQWLGFGLLRLITFLPYRWRCALGRSLGKLLYRLAGKRRRIAEVNLELCFPDLDASARAVLLRENFEHLGMAIVDTGVSWWGRDGQLRRMGSITGLPHLLEALEHGKGVILLTGHMVALDVGGQILAETMARHGKPLFAMYKRSRNVLVEVLMLRGRSRYGGLVFKRQDLRAMLRSLAGNHPVWYAPDQDFGLKQGVFADFLGVPTATLTATAKFAAKTGAKVVPYFPIRLPGDQGFEIRIMPALENYPSGDAVADARRSNEVLEEIVRQYPEQYMWQHRRFKTRPEGSPPLYGQG